MWIHSSPHKAVSNITRAKCCACEPVRDPSRFSRCLTQARISSTQMGAAGSILASGVRRLHRLSGHRGSGGNRSCQQHSLSSVRHLSPLAVHVRMAILSDAARSSVCANAIMVTCRHGFVRCRLLCAHTCATVLLTPVNQSRNLTSKDFFMSDLPGTRTLRHHSVTSG